MKAFVEFAAYGFTAFLIVPCVLYPLTRLFRCVGRSALGRLSRMVVLTLAAVATIATIEAQKRGGTGTTGVPPVESGTTGTTGILPVANPVTNTLHFSSISVPTSGTVTLTAAWPESFLATGQTLDVLGKENLHDVTWTWVTNGIITAGATNISWTLENQSPSNHFYKIIVRDSLTDMDDPDGDGMPNVYELANGTNPFVSDYASAPKIVAGGSGADGVADLASAFATSGEYSIIEVASGIHSGSGWTGLHLPAYPVMITSSDGGRGRAATLRHVAQMAAFYLSATQRTDTVVQGLNIDLVASSGQQMGFWCGGDLPWNGLPAAGTFRNISMRMPNPGVQYFGWFFRHWESNEVVIAASAINASGATDVRGIYAIDSPPMSVENCTFANFPPAGGGTLGYGIQYESTAANWGNAPDMIPIEIVNCLFDVSFTNAYALAPLEQGVAYDVTMWNCIVPLPLAYLPDHEYGTIVTNALTAWCGHLLSGSPAIGAGTDVLHSSYDLDGQTRDERPDIGADEYVPDMTGDADEDGLSDAYEIENGIDPYRADSDFDGVDDATEIATGTDPTDPHSFAQTLTVTVTNTASTVLAVYTAWGGPERVWEPNEQVMFPRGFGNTSYTNASSQGATHVKAYCDLNGNGEYDTSNDILLVREIPHGSTAQINFSFGDVDGDGVTDAQERLDGTDPYDVRNFRLVATVNVESSDVVPGLTNYVAWGFLATGWESNDLTSFAGTTLAYPVTGVATNGELFIKAFRDFNANGIYDEGIDALVSNRLTRVNNGKTVTFKIGDSDDDGISDSVEMDDGTDPFSKLNYCFYLSLTYTDVFQTTNALTFTATFGTNCVYGPCVVEERTWSHDFGHCVAVNGERAAINVWDDANQNGQWDVGETSNRFEIAVTDHDMVVTNSLPYGNFDRNYNSLPDWWDAQEGLDAEGVAHRMYDDPDGDGLINLHEFWCGTHPLLPDGSNTLLSVASRSIDDRIRDVDLSTSISRFVDYFANGATNVFIANTNFWARDLDLSCVSVWHPGEQPGSKAATLITRKHVVMAAHWAVGSYTFCDTNGQVCTRNVLRIANLSDDLRLGQLNAPLPDSFKPASVMSTNYVRYLSSGKYLPALCLNQEKGATVLELEDLNCRVLERGGLWHSQYGKTSMTNYVSVQRNNIRSATPGGNSGCPVLLVVGNELVLHYSIHLSSYTGDSWSSLSGPMLPSRLNAIQNKINEWEGPDAGQYQIVPFDLSTYPELVNQ